MSASRPASVPDRFVSAGMLPPGGSVQAMLDEAYTQFLPDRSGALSQVYPALAEADPAMFGLAVVSTAGDVVVAGNAGVPFTIMSVAKPFVFALVSAVHGIEAVRDRVGVNATGRAFNSAYAVERDPRGRTNPMVNPGAIATTSLAPGTGPSPGKGAVGSFSPLLDAAGNSVRGEQAARYLARRLGLDVLASTPVEPRVGGLPRNRPQSG